MWCGHAQDVFNLLPNLGVEELTRSFAVQSNDMMLAIYLASLTRSVLALHNLIDNKARAHCLCVQGLPDCWVLAIEVQGNSGFTSMMPAPAEGEGRSLPA